MPKTLFTGDQFSQAYNQALAMMRETPIEPTSAFKQAASDAGIEGGEPFKWFLNLAWRKLYGEDHYSFKKN